MVSVALGAAVMILAMAVIMGFKREVAHKMTGFARPRLGDRRAGCQRPRFGTRAPQRAPRELIRATDGSRRWLPMP